MAQKSILSFFKSSDRTVTNNTEKEKKSEKRKAEESLKSKQDVDESPVKKLRTKRKVRCIESDDESAETSKVQNSDSEKDDTEKEGNSNKSPGMVSKKQNKEKKTNESSSKKRPKIKKSDKDKTEKSTVENGEKEKLPVANGEKEESPEPPSKMEIDSPSLQNQKSKGIRVKSTINEQSISTCDDTEITPRRKTARKSIRPAKDVEANDAASKVVKKHPDSDGEKDDSEVTLPKKSKTDESPSSKSEISFEEELETKISDSYQHAKMEIESEKSENGKKSKDNEQGREKIDESRKSENEEKSPDHYQKRKDSESNKNVLKKGRKSKITESNKGSPKNEQEGKLRKEVSDDSSKLSDNDQKCKESENNKKASKRGRKSKKTEHNDESPKKEQKSKIAKVVSDDSKKSNDGKRKTQKETALKKPPGRESIQNFFTPVKKEEKKSSDKNKSKTEDDNEKHCIKAEEENMNENVEEEKSKSVKEDESESQAVECDDSPVKKVAKQKKKIQCLDSDEEESQSLKTPAKMEISDSENKSETSSKESTQEVSSNSEKKSEIPSVKSEDSPSKKEPDTNSKADKEKQKFGCKSTSTATVYDPSKTKYHPIEDACWKENDRVPYLALAKTLDLIENTSGRLKTIEILANFFRSVMVLSPSDLLQSIYLCLNRLAPEYEGIELGIGETLLMKAVAQATGRTLEKIKAEVAIKGDLGLVSESSRGNQRVMFAPPKLTVASVFNKFLEIAKMSGNAAMSKKTDKIQSLFVACRDCEAKYIIRSLSGKLRIGLAEQSILTAIARAAVITPPGQTYPPEVIDASKGMSENSLKELVNAQTLILKTAYCECPNYDLIIPVLLKDGISALPKCCQLSPGRPLKPMLAHPTAGIDIVLERFDKNAFTCEYKYDGERAQIHMTEDGEVKIFSRNQEDNTSKYPDVISRITTTLKETTKSFILDSEAVAWDKESKQILPFQVLSTRKKKDAVESDIVVHVCIMAFDLLYLNGESLVKKPLKERRSLLHSFFNEVENEFMFAQYRDGNSAETMQEFLDESVKGNCEGLMVKALEVDASYEIAKRSHNWLKLKKDYLQGIGDTLDLVVIGGYYGKGKRTGNYGGFLLACYDDENEEFQSICKLGTGFKDENLEAHTTFFKQHILKEPKSYYRFDHGLEPDVWFEAVQVWEIKCADLSISPVHKAAIGIVDPEKGISLRFPRFIRIRDDKSPENATNSAQIADMYQKQEQIQNTSKKNSKVEEDYY